MPRTFAYVRVSTMQQETENQIREIEATGFTLQQHRIITETISGSIPISRRKGFARLLDTVLNMKCKRFFEMCYLCL
jgi:putative DNA-invertase from lambdoid prophage Rac